MNKEEQIKELKDAAKFIAMFKGVTDGIDKVISELSGEEFHTPKEYSEEQFDGQTHSG